MVTRLLVSVGLAGLATALWSASPGLEAQDPDPGGQF